MQFQIHGKTQDISTDHQKRHIFWLSFGHGLILYAEQFHPLGYLPWITVMDICYLQSNLANLGP